MAWCPAFGGPLLADPEWPSSRWCAACETFTADARPKPHTILPPSRTVSGPWRDYRPRDPDR
jgi:hypothetical protein